MQIRMSVYRGESLVSKKLFCWENSKLTFNLNLLESNAMNWNYPNQYIPTPSWSPYHQNGQFDHQGIDPSFTGK